VVERRAVDLERALAAGRDDRLELRREDERAAVVEVIERLDTGSIAKELEPPLSRIPDRDREHAVDPIDEAVAPFEIGVQRDLGIGVGPKRAPAFLELLAQTAPAVDLAVERDPRLPVRREHRLPGGLAEIDDRQALETDFDGTVEPQATRIGPAVGDRVEGSCVVESGVGSSDEAAHVSMTPDSGRRRRCDTLGAARGACKRAAQTGSRYHARTAAPVRVTRTPNDPQNRPRQ